MQIGTACKTLSLTIWPSGHCTVVYRCFDKNGQELDIKTEIENLEVGISALSAFFFFLSLSVVCSGTRIFQVYRCFSS